MTDSIRHLNLADKALAYQQRVFSAAPAEAVGVIYLSGFASDMMGTKACFIDSILKDTPFSFTRFDYRGHGASSSFLIDGCMSDWIQDSLDILDHCTTGKQILVGSSMGGWIALHLLQLRPDRIAGFLGISIAPDFTEELIVPAITEEHKKSLADHGFMKEKDGTIITQKLLDDGRKNSCLKTALSFSGAVTILHGMNDAEVPWSHAIKTKHIFEQTDVKFVLVKNAEHRMSRPQDLSLIKQELLSMIGQTSPLV